MSLTFGFYNSLNNDRSYDAVDMSRIFDGIINDGVYLSIGEKFAVKAATGMGITVGTGRAWFNGTWSYNDSNFALTVDTAEVLLKRIDAVILEVNTTNAVRRNELKMKKGTPSAQPTKPSMTKTGGVYQYPLAYITVDPGVTSITQANIENAVGTTDCPYVTGVLKSTDIDEIVAQWNAQWSEWMTNEQTSFETWYNNLQVILDDNVATNLTNRVLALESKVKTIVVGKTAPSSMTGLSEGDIYIYVPTLPD